MSTQTRPWSPSPAPRRLLTLPPSASAHPLQTDPQALSSVLNAAAALTELGAHSRSTPTQAKSRAVRHSSGLCAPETRAGDTKHPQSRALFPSAGMTVRPARKQEAITAREVLRAPVPRVSRADYASHPNRCGRAGESARGWGSNSPGGGFAPGLRGDDPGVTVCTSDTRERKWLLFLN